jgi:CheY-like chemotaxis protein
MAAKIFIVEDNPDSREMMACLFKLEGYDVVCAEDGLEAIDMLHSFRPSLIITDIQMPNLDGIELIRWLREQPEMRRIPVLVMSAYRSGMVDEALKAGANASTCKPLQFESLFQTVKQLLPLSLLLIFMWQDLSPISLL